MHRGYIKLFRSVTDNFTWKDKPFSYGQAWVHMLILANHKEGVIWVSKTPVKVARGQLGWSQDRLSSEFGWTRQQVRTFLKHLKRDQMINQEKHGKMSIITILNYDKFHGDNQENNHPVTNRQPTDNQPVTTNKNDKKDKNDKKEYITPRLGEFKNVRLTQKDMNTLLKGTSAYPPMTETQRAELIERLSGYIAQKGDKYKSHYATIQAWNRRGGNGATKGITAEQEQAREQIKRDIAIIEDSMPGAQAAYDRDPSAENKRWLEGKQRELAKLQRELEG
jgi:hypothetical protein